MQNCAYLASEQFAPIDDFGQKLTIGENIDKLIIIAEASFDDEHQK